MDFWRKSKVSYFIGKWCSLRQKWCSKWCSEIGTETSNIGYEMNETHVLADAGAWVLFSKIEKI